MLTPGCSSSNDLSDICGWLRDPQGCYRTLFDDVRTRCGAVYDDASAADEEFSPPRGRFVTRNTLDTCVLTHPDTGEVTGQVRFDTAPALTEFPLQGLQVTRLDARNEPCSSMTITSAFNFSLKFYPCTEDPSDDPPVCKDAFSGETSLSGVGKDPNAVVGGEFSVTTEEGRDIYLTTCPDGQQYRFNRFESVKCDGYDQLLPHAEIDSDAGGTAPPWIEDIKPYEGWIRLRLTYPPYEGELQGAEPTVIQYVNCTIPFQDPCFDGMKNYYETDLDCGGPFVGESPNNQPGAPPVARACPRCDTGMICETDDDCDTSEGVQCLDDPTSGFKRCKKPEPATDPDPDPDPDP
ncbi:Hypothetical protein CAP_5553 [Chondromyces apiculatus DSM 436]|uniref:Uncharacterized protein n=1 Tax=Chondromyces apiculatus DSM 436 TaxID=1192034 RepID=A0A017T4E4_9BACT|nr:Hypothetical protein CAP_5553 [Chondromyces apiculatus DSM 436]